MSPMCMRGHTQPCVLFQYNACHFLPSPLPLIKVMMHALNTYNWPTVKHRINCGMDSFCGLTGSESTLWSYAQMTTLHTVQVHEHYRPLQCSAFYSRPLQPWATFEWWNVQSYNNNYIWDTIHKSTWWHHQFNIWLPEQHWTQQLVPAARSCYCFEEERLRPPGLMLHSEME